jgi:hypothetical protein
MKKLKPDVECILEAYQKEVESLISETLHLYGESQRASSKCQHNDLASKLRLITLRKELIDHCKEECIKDL